MGKCDRSQNTLQVCSSSDWNLRMIFMVPFFSSLPLLFYSPLLQPFDLLLSTCMKISREPCGAKQSTWRNYSVISSLREKPLLLKKRGRRKERNGSTEIGSVTKLQGYQCPVVCCEKCLVVFQSWAKSIVLNNTKAKRATFHAAMKTWSRGCHREYRCQQNDNYQQDINAHKAKCTQRQRSSC